MASSMRNTCVEQWRLCELTNILDSIEDDISDAVVRLSYFVLPGTNSSFRKAVCSGARSGWLG